MAPSSQRLGPFLVAQEFRDLSLRWPPSGGRARRVEFARFIDNIERRTVGGRGKSRVRSPHASWPRTHQTANPTRAAAKTTKMAASMPWKVQNRPAGWYVSIWRKPCDARHWLNESLAAGWWGDLTGRGELGEIDARPE